MLVLFNMIKKIKGALVSFKSPDDHHSQGTRLGPGYFQRQLEARSFQFVSINLVLLSIMVPSTSREAPPCTRNIHTHTLTLTQPHLHSHSVTPHSHTHTLNVKHICSCSYIPSHIHTQSYPYANMFIHTYAYTYPHTHIYRHMHTHARIPSHTHAHPHSHTLSFHHSDFRDVTLQHFQLPLHQAQVNFSCNYSSRGLGIGSLHDNVRQCFRTSYWSKNSRG